MEEQEESWPVLAIRPHESQADDLLEEDEEFFECMEELPNETPLNTTEEQTRAVAFRAQYDQVEDEEKPVRVSMVPYITALEPPVVIMTEDSADGRRTR